MFGAAFGHGSLRKYVIYFGTLFNNIYLNRYDATGTVVQNMRVPINYGPREKFLARLDGNPDLDRSIAIQLPRMSFEMIGFRHDRDRALNKLQKITVADPNNPGSLTYQYAPVPWDIDFELSIMVKNAEDGTYIVEQILPYFNPAWSASLNINEDMNQSFDVPIFLNDIGQTDTYEGSFENRRTLIWTLRFTIKAWFFGPTKTGGKIIKRADVNFHVPPIGFSIEDAYGLGLSEVESLTITPGLTANGEAVNWYGDANAAIRPTSVAANTIGPDDAYGFLIDLSGDV